MRRCEHVVDMFPQTDDFWICFRKRRKRSKSVDMFPDTDDINLIATRHVETVCLLSKFHEAKHHVSVKLDMDEMDITSAESKATYEEIKQYVAEHNGSAKSDIDDVFTLITYKRRLHAK